MFGPDDFEVQIQQENPPGIHAEPSIPPAQDEEYGDFIVKHGQNMGGKFLPVNELFGILYIPLNEIVENARVQLPSVLLSSGRKRQNSRPSSDRKSVV